MKKVNSISIEAHPIFAWPERNSENALFTGTREQLREIGNEYPYELLPLPKCESLCHPSRVDLMRQRMRPILYCMNSKFVVSLSMGIDAGFYLSD